MMTQEGVTESVGRGHLDHFGQTRFCSAVKKPDVYDDETQSQRLSL